MYVCVVGAASAGPIRSLATLARTDPTASHHLLIPFVSLALIFMARDAVFASVRAAAPAGLLVIGAGLAIAWAGQSSRTLTTYDALSLATAGFVLLLLGGFLCAYGFSAFKAALFPLLFLAFTIPVPADIIHAVTRFLKSGTADIVAGLFAVTGTPYHREAFVFSLPTFAIEIADECSGIRSSIALLLTGLLAGHMFLRFRTSRILLLAAIVPIAIFKNGVRIVCLSLLAKYVDPGFLTGQLHHEGGFVFFLVGLVTLLPIFLLLQRSEVRVPENRLAL